MPEHTWPSLYTYALAHLCTTCGAVPGSECNAPRKKARHKRISLLIQQAGKGAVEPDPLARLHSTRAEAGIRHRSRDIAQAPDKEDRIPGQRYDSLGTVPSHHKTPHGPHTLLVPADPLDTPHQDAELRHETEIVWTEDVDAFDYVRETIDPCAGSRARPLRWASDGRRVGYSVLATTAPNNGSPGRFTRRIFWVKAYDRSEQPDGTYRTTAPSEAADPRTVRPGIKGSLTERAWGRPLNHLTT